MANKKYTDINTGTVYTNSVILVANPNTGALKRVTVAQLLAASGTEPGGGLTQLSTPTLTATVISSTQIDLSWTNVANESSYRLEWSANGTSGWTQIGGTIAANTTTYSHTGLTASTPYYYRLKAVGDGVTYSDSNYGTGSGTTNSATQLSTPTAFEATAISSTQIDLVWGDVANESSYRLDWSADGSTGWTQIGGTIAAGSTSYSHTGLTASTTYYYRLKAVGDGVTYTDSNYATDNVATSGSFEFVVWTDATANITTGANGSIATTSAGTNIGARATKKLTGSFIIEGQFKNPYSGSELAGIWLSSVNNTDFATGAGSNTGIIGGFAVYLDDVYRYTGPDTQGSNSAIILTDGAADAMWVRIERSGDNLLYYTSPDGSAYTLRHTHTGAFTGLTECFIKFMNSGGTNVGFDQVRGQGLTTI